ncbi:n-acetylglutamate synthase [Flavivirga aquatica]|uniref:N-acetylglutamate synthase n=1 Tax=Flavivirga aquatica TaxID=1849968 RepID=A0A1E5TEV2_9FLAO|nr:n-acetylglutamate synthase [Flavivirga aquatica]OEK09891.1 n-acetylglutamate synthase [Flavivirga aquatica]
MNYDNKNFKPILNSENSEITPNTIFLYKQKGNILTSSYKGDNIIEGYLLGIVHDDGTINMVYHQVNKNGNLMTGTCISKPKLNKEGKIQLHEKWQWTSGNKTKGKSILEEI